MFEHDRLSPPVAPHLARVREATPVRDEGGRKATCPHCGRPVTYSDSFVRHEGGVAHYDCFAQASGRS